MKRKSLKTLILFFLTTTALTSGYYYNFWNVVDHKSFDNFEIYCQSQVIGRLIRTESNGFFSEAGLNGWVRDDSVMKDMTWDDMTYFQFEIYKKGLKLENTEFIIYDSQIGGQAMAFSLLDKMSPFSKSVNIELFWIITSLSLAILITFFIYWVYLYYGFGAALITFLLNIFSIWLTFWGRNIYMTISVFYLPFIVFLWLLHAESLKKSTVTSWKLFLLSLAMVFAKLFFTGFEFISSFLIMISIPLFYYLFLNQWRFRLFLTRLTSVAAGAISAMVLNALLFSYQLSTIKGSFSYGLKYMLYCFLKRSHGNSADFPDGFKDSLESGVFEVIRTYLNAHSVTIGRQDIHFSALIIIFILISLVSIFSEKISPSTFKNLQRNKVLVYTTWISLLAPMSWFIIFKAHSFIHTTFDEIVWYMPFVLFGFALTGSVLTTLFKDINSWFDNPQEAKQ
jgi:hypothetical protein